MYVLINYPPLLFEKKKHLYMHASLTNSTIIESEANQHNLLHVYVRCTCTRYALKRSKLPFTLVISYKIVLPPS